MLKYASLPFDGPFLGMQFLNNNALSNALNNANTAFFCISSLNLAQIKKLSGISKDLG